MGQPELTVIVNTASSTMGHRIGLIEQKRFSTACQQCKSGAADRSDAVTAQGKRIGGQSHPNITCMQPTQEAH